MKIAVIGATGLVGTEMLNVLEEFKLPVDELLPSASEKSVGKTIKFCKQEINVISISNALEKQPDIALFSAGSDVSKEWAPRFAQAGTTVIDNSSCWRKYPEIPLVVPEVNGPVLKKEDRIIANPNCSTIQMVAAIAPLHRTYRIKRMVISTYQSVTGTGMKAVQQLYNERNGIPTEKVYPWTIDMNCFPHGGSFQEDGYTTEEQKLVDETHKILNDSSIRITATVVRIPVIGGHSEAVNIEFEQEYELADIQHILKQEEGIVIQDNPSENQYPMPLFTRGKNEVFVGRIRRDYSIKNGLNLWIVADNLRKGAATNAVQIAKYLIDHDMLTGR